MSALADQNRTDVNKLLGLEALRFVAAFAVLVWHYQYFTYSGLHAVGFDLTRQPFFRELELFYRFGYYGVDVFWCISGFIFFWKYDRSVASGRLGGLRFAVLRFSRLYPLHFMTLILVALLQSAYQLRTGGFFAFEDNNAYHFLLQIFMVSSWGLEQGPSFNAPIWSVSVELIAYGIFFLGLRYFATPVMLIGAVLSVCVAAKVVHLYSPVLDCLTFFFIGGAVSIAKRRVDDSRFGTPVFVASISWLLILPFIAFLTPAHRLHAFPMLVLTLWFPVLIYLLSSTMTMPRPVRLAVEAAGNMTYASYLIHFPILLIIVLASELADFRIPFYQPGFLLFFMALTLMLSRWTFSWFELPAQDWIRRRCLAPAGLVAAR